MRGPRRGSEMAYLHAMTMRAHEKDNQRFGTLMIVVGSGVALVDGILWLLGGHNIGFGVGALLALLGVVLGVALHIRHGRLLARWTQALEVLSRKEDQR